MNNSDYQGKSLDEIIQENTANINAFLLLSNEEFKKKFQRKKFWFKFYWIYKKKIEKQIEKESKSDKIQILNISIKFLTNEEKNIYFNIWTSKSYISRKINEIEYDVINYLLEEHINILEETENLVTDDNDFNYYPNSSDKLFNKKIYMKKEFNDNKIIEISSYDNYLKNQSKLKGFKRSQSQKFVKNFVSNNTPYNGILLWHGVGVGKTCAAISIAENFRDIIQKQDQKILVLTPGDTLRNTWKDEIFNIEKELYDKNSYNKQCTGSKYLKELSFLYDNNKNERQKRIQINRTIDKYYEFYGYQKLAFEIQRVFDKIDKNYDKIHVDFTKNAEYKKLNYIKEKYSNRVIILDEAHITREGSGTEESKKVPPFLEMITRYAHNTKLIVLSATPMYNISKEIIWLINLLRWNDKISPIEDYLIFKSGGKKTSDGIDIKIWDEDTISHDYFNLSQNIDITDLSTKSKAIKLFIDKSRGYISYLRGEDPYRFPLKLFPDIENRGYTPNPDKSYNNVKIDSNEKIQDNQLILYKNEMSNWQFHFVSKFLQLKDKQSIDDDDDSKKGGFGIQLLQSSNIVFPDYSNLFSLSDSNGNIVNEPMGIIGDKSLEKIFDINDNIYSYKVINEYDLSNLEGDNVGVFHRNKIIKFSTKFKSIIDNIVGNYYNNPIIKPSQGIVFIYSQFIEHGIKSLALMLEENGFNRYIWCNKENKYTEKNMLNIKTKDPFCARNKVFFSQLQDKSTFKQARYIYLDGTASKADLFQLVKAVRGEKLFDKDGNKLNNINGEEILVILGSKVVEQGISFFNVRETHILDPWHHLNMMEQAAGRSIRNFSHKNLPRPYQNVTLYLHSSALPQNLAHLKTETYDEKVYRKAYIKKKKMAIISRIIKVNAIDCQLNKFGNVFLEKNLLNTTQLMFNSKNDYIDVPLFDEDYSQRCDYNLCDYNCEWVTDQKSITNADMNINSDTYSEEFARDNIDTAKEYIKAIFIKEFSYTLPEILDKIKVLGENICDDYIYIGLDEIINNKEIIYDMYNREGTLISRDGVYIFTSNELNDYNTPLFYRKKPLNTITKKINLNNTQKYIKLSQNNFQNDEETSDSSHIETLYDSNFDYSKLVIYAFGSIHDETKNILIQNVNNDNNAFIYIINNYYKEIMSKDFLIDIDISHLIIDFDKKKKDIKSKPKDTIIKTNGYYPNVFDITRMKVLYKIDRLAPQDKKKLFEITLTNIIKNNNLPTNELDEIIIKHYTQKYPSDQSYSIFTRNDIENLRNNPLIHTSSTNYPYYFRISYYDSTQKSKYYEKFFEYNEEQKIWQESATISDLFSKLTLVNKNITDKTKNIATIYGFLNLSETKVNEEEYFYITNKINYKPEITKEGIQSKKTVRTGARCGHGIGHKNTPEIIESINFIYNREKYQSSKPDKVSQKKGKTKSGKSLCEELELMLRYRDYLLDEQSSKIVSGKHLKYFYNAEESYFEN